MTEETSGTLSDSSVSEWLVRENACAQLCRTIITENKRALLDVLATSGITAVIVQFDGCGDSGQVEDIEVQGEDRPDIPSGTINLARVSWDDLKIQHTTTSVREAIDTLVYDLLSETHRGWENNEGAYGTVTFDVGKRSILLEFNERHTESDHSEHEF